MLPCYTVCCECVCSPGHIHSYTCPSVVPVLCLQALSVPLYFTETCVPVCVYRICMHCVLYHSYVRTPTEEPCSLSPPLSLPLCPSLPPSLPLSQKEFVRDGSRSATETGKIIRCLLYMRVLHAVLLVTSVLPVYSECLPGVPTMSCDLLREVAPYPPDPPSKLWRPEQNVRGEHRVR